MYRRKMSDCVDKTGVYPAATPGLPPPELRPAGHDSDTVCKDLQIRPSEVFFFLSPLWFFFFFFFWWIFFLPPVAQPPRLQLHFLRIKSSDKRRICDDVTSATVDLSGS